MNKNKKYLFICAYAQSRSKAFSERFMKMGIKSMFAGHFVEEADFPLSKKHIEWADVIVFLDSGITKTTNLETIHNYHGKEIIKHYITDEPKYFEEEINILIHKLEKEN